MPDLRIDYDRKHRQFTVFEYGGWGERRLFANFGTLAAAREAYPQAHVEAGVVLEAPATTGASIWDVPPLATGVDHLAASSARPAIGEVPSTSRPSNAKWAATTAVFVVALIVVGILWNGDH
jgi:hypothetical protein